jgi:hypothetical protein
MTPAIFAQIWLGFKAKNLAYLQTNIYFVRGIKPGHIQTELMIWSCQINASHRIFTA